MEVGLLEAGLMEALLPVALVGLVEAVEVVALLPVAVVGLVEVVVVTMVVMVGEEAVLVAAVGDPAAQLEPGG